MTNKVWDRITYPFPNFDGASCPFSTEIESVFPWMNIRLGKFEALIKIVFLGVKLNNCKSTKFVDICIIIIIHVYFVYHFQI